MRDMRRTGLTIFAALLLGCGSAHGRLDAGMDAGSARALDAGVDATSADAGDERGCAPRSTAAEFDAFVERTLRAACEREIACGFGWIDWASADDCARYTVVHRDRGWARTRAEVVRGALVLDPAWIDACLAELRACEPPQSPWARLGDGSGFARRESPPSACRRAVRLRCPVPGDGATCGSFNFWRVDNCADGLVCDTRTDRCDPRCRPQTPLGGSCDSSWYQCAASTDHEWVLCDDDSTAIGDDDLGTCRFIEEAPRGESGERCGRVELDGEERLVRCREGLSCQPTSGDAWICRGPTQDEESCSVTQFFGERCRPGFYCDPATRACRPRSGSHRPVLVGEPCERGGACDDQYRTVCHDGVCVEAGRAAGQPCDNPLWEPNDYRRCDDGLTCEWRNTASRDFCVRPFLRPDGARCDYEALERECAGKCSREGRCVSWDDGLPSWC